MLVTTHVCAIFVLICAFKGPILYFYINFAQLSEVQQQCFQHFLSQTTTWGCSDSFQDDLQFRWLHELHWLVHRWLHNFLHSFTALYRSGVDQGGPVYIWTIHWKQLFFCKMGPLKCINFLLLMIFDAAIHRKCILNYFVHSIFLFNREMSKTSSKPWRCHTSVVAPDRERLYHHELLSQTWCKCPQLTLVMWVHASGVCLE